nr:DUF4092 domain-containing protein [Escherichia coli]
MPQRNKRQVKGGGIARNVFRLNKRRRFRNDKNYWLAFGEKRAWDKNELAYITEAPSLVEPENVTRDTATFNLPFISLGQVGEGKMLL